MSDEWSDEELTSRLTELLATADAVPPRLVAAAKAAYPWRDLIDPHWDTGAVEVSLRAGLARLTFDSALAEREAPLTRASAASRALTLIAAELTIELEIDKDVMYGRLIPAEPGDVRMGTLSGRAATAAVDEIGRFVLRGTPGEPFRLHCRTRSGVAVCTTWICP